MSALDQAFIKAYAKEPAPVNADPSSAGAAQAPAVAERTARAPQGRTSNTQIENIYAAGTLYRIETPQAAEPAPVPPPHFATRVPRRLPLRYRLAQMEGEEVPAPVARRQPQPVIEPTRHISPTPSTPQPPPRMKAKIPAPPLVLPPPTEVIHAVIEELRSPIEGAATVLPFADPVEIRQRWDELFGDSPVVADSAVAVWPREEELASAQASSLISLDLETMPKAPVVVTELIQESVIHAAMETGAPAASSAKTYRFDAAHVAVPPPHRAPTPTLEDLIKPAGDRPLAISDEEAAELVGTASTAPIPEVAAPKIPALAPNHVQQLVPAWEVDRFYWPALCDKLLRDEHSYFAQAGSKIVSAVKDGLKSLAITGSRRGEGRTTLALCLARSAAKAGLKVVLVDADFARPQLAATLGLEIAASWHEAALGKSSLSEAAIKSIEDNLTFLPLDVSTAVAPLSLTDPRLTKTLRDVASAFDLLIIDLGPTAAGDESLFPVNEQPPADAAIVVRDLRYCTPAESQAIGERLSLSGIEAVGIAENFVPHEKLVA
jgi:Mrp family chromosome partitioning ATPase